MTSNVVRRALRLRLSSPFSPIPTSSSSLFRSSPLIPQHKSSRIPTSSFLLSPARFASSRARPAAAKLPPDENLKRVLDSEIECAKQSASTTEGVDLPDGFPFEIIDNPGDQAITLKREFEGEIIQINVFMNLDSAEDMNEDDEDASEEGDAESSTADSSIQPELSLVVMIDKGEGPALEFCCNLNPNELQIESMLMKKQDDPDDENAYQGPQFSDLDESLQKAFCKYLEDRGIKSSLFDFLQEYMISKDDKEYLVWLKNMKEFIGK